MLITRSLPIYLLLILTVFIPRTALAITAKVEFEYNVRETTKIGYAKRVSQSDYSPGTNCMGDPDDKHIIMVEGPLSASNAGSATYINGPNPIEFNVSNVTTGTSKKVNAHLIGGAFDYPHAIKGHNSREYPKCKGSTGSHYEFSSNPGTGFTRTSSVPQLTPFYSFKLELIDPETWRSGVWRGTLIIDDNHGFYKNADVVHTMEVVIRVDQGLRVEFPNKTLSLQASPYQDSITGSLSFTVENYYEGLGIALRCTSTKSGKCSLQNEKYPIDVQVQLGGETETLAHNESSEFGSISSGINVGSLDFTVNELKGMEGKKSTNLTFIFYQPLP